MYGKLTMFQLTTLVCWLLAAGVMAYDGNQDNWLVDGLNGGIQIAAELVDSPCSLAPESSVQEINLGRVAQLQLTQAGKITAPQALHLILNHCLSSGITRAAEHGDNLYWIQEQPVVLMTVYGDEDPIDPQLFRLIGSTEGVALRLEDSQHQPLIPGERSRPQVLNAGHNELMLYARLSRTAQALSAGEFASVVSIGLEYF